MDRLRHRRGSNVITAPAPVLQAGCIDAGGLVGRRAGQPTEDLFWCSAGRCRLQAKVEASTRRSAQSPMVDEFRRTRRSRWCLGQTIPLEPEQFVTPIVGAGASVAPEQPIELDAVVDSSGRPPTWHRYDGIDHPAGDTGCRPERMGPQAGSADLICHPTGDGSKGRLVRPVVTVGFDGASDPPCEPTSPNRWARVHAIWPDVDRPPETAERGPDRRCRRR
jgi:hypothetical protein